MDHIVENLWLGGQQDADNLIRNNPENITVILNVRGPDAYQPPGRNQSAEHPGKAYKWIPAPDTGLVSPGHVKEAVAWLQQQSTKQHRTLIHCMFGISRAPGFLAAFMVSSGISATPEEAKATISIYRRVQPAAQIAEPVWRVVLISALTGLPNRQAFDGERNNSKATPFVAVADIDFMRAFNDSYGRIAGDMLLRRFAKILIGVGLDAYHNQGDEFLCKGAFREELNAQLSQARQLFRQPFQLYADGRIQTVEDTGFAFAIGSTVEEAQSALRAIKQGQPRNESPEWLRKIVATAGRGSNW
ncbi:MAG: diguanylate cyclase [Terriglobales bacterium]|jgi:GGDEF domain-containing protein